MADPLSGIAIIICIAFGVLTFVLLFIFANRQIKRFSLKSVPGPHFPIAQDAPKSLQNEINRRLDVVKNIAYQPPLLKKSDDVYFDESMENNGPCHLYRMKALDSTHILDAAILSVEPSKVRQYHQDYRVYLVQLLQKGLFGKLEIPIVHRYCDLYDLARHEQGDFNKQEYEQFMEYMLQIKQNITQRSVTRQQALSRGNASPAHSAHSARDVTNGPAVPSCLQVETPVEDKKSIETSV